MSATEAHKATPFDQRMRAAILAVKTAFGAPGDWGYETKKGRSLYVLYDLFNEMVAQSLIEKAEKTEALSPLEGRLVDCLASIMDTPIMSVRDVMGNHQTPLDLYLVSTPG